MTQLLGKKGLASSAQIELVEKTIERQTKVGGAFHGRAEFLKTFRRDFCSI